MAILSRDDPSLIVEVEEESGQTLVRGMGELHLEVACRCVRARSRARAHARACVCVCVSKFLDPNHNPNPNPNPNPITNPSRMATDFGVEVETGRAHIAYRETAGGAAGPTDIVYDHTFGDTKRLFAGLNGSIRPTSAEESGLEEGQYLMQPPSISLTKGASFVRLP